MRSSPCGRRMDKWIAFWGIDSTTHQRDIWTVSTRGGKPIRVTNDAATEVSPSWSPNGRYLYFSSDRSGPAESLASSN